MNFFKTINIDYLRASKTIETVLVSKEILSKVFFVYNCEGNSFRVFENHLNLINFFQDKAESNFHFDTESQLDNFLSEVNLSA